MKSTIDPDRFYLECSCGMPDHLLIIETFRWNEGNEGETKSVEFQFVSNYNEPWYQRIKYALKYVLFKQKFGVSNSVCINSSTVAQLEEIVTHLKNFLLISDKGEQK